MIGFGEVEEPFSGIYYK